MRLSRQQAEAAVGVLAERLGMTTAGTAEAVLRVTTANMYAELLPLIARHGVDHRDFVLMAYGGAGPTHAFLLAAEVGIRAVLIPSAPGALCALGAARTDLAMDFVRSGLWELSDVAGIEDGFTQLEGRARDWLAEQGLDGDGALFERSADMRYVGQSYELTVGLGDRPSAEEFHRRYERVYSYSDHESPVEVLHLRLVVRVPMPEPARAVTSFGGDPAPVEVRSVTHRGTEISVPVHRRANLPSGWRAEGPVIVTQYDTTTFVTPEFDVAVDAYGNLRGEART
jgi:N-methylhydantoinase A